MTSDLFADNLRPVDELHALLRRHGMIKTLLALPFAIMKSRKVQVLRDHELSDHLRRDIGLFREIGTKQHWELR
jgi:hypothetical protein